MSEFVNDVSIENLLHVLNLFAELKIRYWLDGGWGVDALYGQQTRKHRDVDIDFDAAYTKQVLEVLKQNGYQMQTDELPVRAELYCAEYGYIDIHPFEISPSGKIRQANPEGGLFEFENGWFGTVCFAGFEIPCISTEGQFAFHSGYELREKDVHDLRLLNEIEQRCKKR